MNRMTGQFIGNFGYYAKFFGVLRIKKKKILDMQNHLFLFSCTSFISIANLSKCQNRQYVDIEILCHTNYLEYGSDFRNL